MAQTNDIAAAKARKQKIILAVAGLALVGLAVIQVPKLMKSDSPPAAVAADTTAAPVADATVPTASAAVVVAAPTATLVTAKPAAYVAGVALPGGTVVRVSTGQIASFTLFETKDPFVQQVGDEVPTDASGVAPAPATEAPAGGAASAAPGGTTPAAKPAPIKYATINLDGKPQQVQVKQQFPKGDPLFVLVSVKKKEAKIGVAGGSFDDSQTVVLAQGKKVTLVNSATGVRYELKLVYTGSEPETLTGFSTTPEQSNPSAAATTEPVSTGGVTATATP